MFTSGLQEGEKKKKKLGRDCPVDRRGKQRVGCQGGGGKKKIMENKRFYPTTRNGIGGGGGWGWGGGGKKKISGQNRA